CQPGLIIGLPVGFVNAAEVKSDLLKSKVPYITLLGHRGGSSMAVACVNALLHLAACPGQGG
ncbi:MAG: precorrin-8X methylmutase, partial [Dehalococcoidia bacterium]|nr:precorrin-8X methylmutase [Dehalococcoidia bacterium]